uniref:RRM domain-containing protein n=1 Tax=Myotis lucifugus TaxID=59463 RepID=G1P9N3_MYOLU
MADKIHMSLDDIRLDRSQRGGHGRGCGCGGSGGKDLGRTEARLPPREAGVVERRPPHQRAGAAGRSRTGRTSAESRLRQLPDKWQHSTFRWAFGRGAGLITGGKLLLSNLDFRVSDADIPQLFAEFGPLKKAGVHYNRSGRSLGTAHVHFERKADALEARKQYNGVPLYGRPLNIRGAPAEATGEQAGTLVAIHSGGVGRPVGRLQLDEGHQAFGRPEGRLQPDGGHQKFGRPAVRFQRCQMDGKEMDALLDDYNAMMDTS